MTETSSVISSSPDVPLVSIIMNCYNGEKYLRESIDSVLCQSYQNWEIIFWDNCSTDNSAKICQSYDAKIRYYKGEIMPFIIAGVVKSMALSFLGNSKVIEKVIILLLETLAKKTDSDVDDKLVKMLKESLGHKK